MVSNKKFLRSFYFTQKFKPDRSTTWVSRMPEVPFDAIVSDPEYQAKRDKYVTKGPMVWIFEQMNKRSPMTTRDLFDNYKVDEFAKSQHLFNSKLIRYQRYEEELLPHLPQRRIHSKG